MIHVKIGMEMPMRNRTKGNRSLLSGSIKVLTLLLIWSGYLSVYDYIYKEITFYIDKQADALAQFLFILTYSVNEMLLLLLLYDVLLLVSVVIILWDTRTNRMNLIVTNVELIMIIIVSMVALAPLLTRLWPFFLVDLLIVGTLLFVIYILFKPEANVIVIEVKDEPIKVLGPFKTKEEAEQQAKSFLDYWMPYYQQKLTQLEAVITEEELESYKVRILVKLQKRNQFS